MLIFQKVVHPEQIAVAARLAHEIWNEHFIDIIGQGQIDYMLEKFQSVEAMTKQLADGYEYYLFLEEGQPVGYFGIQEQADRTLYLSKLYLLKACRGKGYARQAFEKIKSLAADKNLTMIWLTVNIDNHDTIAVYKRFGMTLLRKQKADIGNGYVMDDEVYGYELEAAAAPANPAN